jgi:hypothetical protein
MCLSLCTCVCTHNKDCSSKYLVCADMAMALGSANTLNWPPSLGVDVSVDRSEWLDDWGYLGPLPSTARHRANDSGDVGMPTQL